MTHVAAKIMYEADNLKMLGKGWVWIGTEWAEVSRAVFPSDAQV